MEKHTKKNFNGNIKIALFVLGIFGLTLSIYSWRVIYAPFDLPITLWLQKFDNAVLRSFMESISYMFGSWRLMIIVTIGALLLWRIEGRKEAIFFVAAGIVSLVQIVLKAVIGRARPLASLVQIFSVETTQGYPSGHAFASILIFGFLLYLILTRVTHLGLRIISLIFFPLLILLIGVSRIFLGVHWTTDVLGGYFIGGFFLACLIWLYEWAKQRPIWVNKPI